VKIKRLARSSHHTWNLPALLLAAVLLVAMATACGGGEEKATATATAARSATAVRTGTPAATATAARTGTPTATAMAATEMAATATPAGQVCGPAARQATIKPGPTPGISDTEILLGGEVILSGTNGAVYATVPKATKAYFDYINDTQGGVCGRKIVYQYEDNFDDGARGLETVRRLVEQDKVFAMVGALSEVAHPATWEYLNQNGVPDAFVSAGGARFGADPCGHPWTVQVIGSYTIDGAFLAQYIAEYHPGETVAVLWENDTIGQDGFAGLKQTLDPNNNPIVAVQSYEYTDISVGSQIANLAKSKADVLVLHSNLGFIAQAIKAADRLGWHPQIVGPYITTDDMVFSFVPSALIKGMVATNANKMASWRDTDPAVAQHYEIMQNYGGPTPTNFTIYAQILAEVAVESLKRSCDNLTREGFMEAIESIKDFHSDLMLDEVNFSFSPTDHVAYQSDRYVEAKVDENGKGKWEYFGPVRQFEGIQ
jgi:ABC-type branched-subunit amino acid transport system substrate-binding protein